MDRADCTERVVCQLLLDDYLKSEDFAAQRPVLANRAPVRVLRLNGMCFLNGGTGSAAGWLAAAIPLSELTALSITNCEHGLCLLQAFAAADEKSRHLRHLELIESCSRPSEQSMSIDDFLTSFDTLETLVISATKTLTLNPSLKAVANHRQLRSLYLDCQFKPGSNPPSRYASKHVSDELTKCKLLQQLALKFPQLNHDDDFANDSETCNYLVSGQLH